MTFSGGNRPSSKVSKNEKFKTFSKFKNEVKLSYKHVTSLHFLKIEQSIKTLTGGCRLDIRSAQYIGQTLQDASFLQDAEHQRSSRQETTVQNKNTLQDASSIQDAPHQIQARRKTTGYASLSKKTQKINTVRLGQVRSLTVRLGCRLKLMGQVVVLA